MVTQEGQENGIGFWDVSGYPQLEETIRGAIDTFDIPFEIEDIIVFGSYGSGVGVPGQSDVDIIVSGVFNGVLSGDELNAIQAELASYIESHDIVAGFDEFNGVDISVEDPAYVHDILLSYWAFEPVTHYFSMVNDEKVEYESIT